MTTALGRFLRKLRIDSSEILKDMAIKLGVSSAFLSAVENGKKKMPDSWIKKLETIYALTKEQTEQLNIAIIETNNIIEINLQNVNSEDRELAISFAREFNSIDAKTREQLMKILKQRKEKQ